MPFAKIIVTNSTTPGAQPNPLDLSIGELTLNAADGRLFGLSDDNTVVKLADKNYESRITTLENSPGVWGSISGTLSNQIDLTTALNTKLNTSALSNAVFNTEGITGGAKITLSPNYGIDADFDIVSANNQLTVTTVDDIITLQHSSIDRTNTNDSVQGVHGDPINVITEVTSNSFGHLTGVKTTALTFPGIQSIEDRLDTLDTHASDINNPHNVTAAQLNLDNVDNTSDADKPISTATQNALDTKPSSSDFDNIVKITQGDYDLITPDPNTLYIITI